jgi:hypothetical protein
MTAMWRERLSRLVLLNPEIKDVSPNTGSRMRSFASW